MLRIKIGDTVKITAEKDKGKEGKVEVVLTNPLRVIIPDINIVKKHVKGRQGQKGGIYDIPKPLNAGKIALICPKCKKVTRVGVNVVGDEKVRVCKKCGREIDSKK